MKLSSISLWLAMMLPWSVLTACNRKSGDDNVTASAQKENVDKGSSKLKKKKKGWLEERKEAKGHHSSLSVRNTSAVR